ncbi:tol-pal system YbgF family protein [Emticicia sp. BO119]|uniref:tetratricopeptide repeat protein n=1 Tax=Emticicia sp. BO119 TaxID=2757768 RepID=UPI0015F07714|nr:tetratricopeptide repeat protein [Emticicia sp. BO119]MBA4851912.1 tetratricopeptide repeat protein [Emticicia sp. BO119]
MIRYLSILILFIPLLVHSQDLKETFDFANELYDKKDYSGAANTYRRVIFFDKQEEFRKRCYKNIADCLYATQNYEEAADYYELAFYQQRTDSTKAEVLFRKLSCFLILGNFEYAEIELVNIPDKLTDEQQRRKTFYSAILHFSTEKYDESKKEFLTLIEPNNSEARQKIEQLFVKNDKISRLSPKKAKVLSIILPGLGQFYAGDVKNGFNSLLLTGGVVTWGILAAIGSPAPLDIFITMVPWFQRYYMGGYKKAEVIAENQKKKRRSKVYNQILDEVSQ